LIQVEKSRLLYDRFRVVATDNTDQSYFLHRSKGKETDADEFYWCRANQPLNLRDVVEGYLYPSDKFAKLPTLIIGDCYAIIPTELN
jgi:hypothetical protein